MPTKFFTNNADNTLLKKLAGVFQFTDVYYFDALVGYFRSSGYFRIRKYLENVAWIRILVGINVDKLIRDAAGKGLEFNLSSEITIDKVKQAIRQDIQHSDYDKEVEEGIIQFIEDVASGKMEIRAHPQKNIHAKIYIFRQKVEHEHAGYGAVITGSSNLTEAGIEKNFEFNVELRDYDDIKFATDTFNKLWEESVEILPEEIQKVRRETYLNDEFTPFEIFIKLLIEYFGKSIEYDPESITDLPPGYRKLAYQIDAVNDGYNKLMQHNGFILADVVGLGKTIVAVIIAKKFYFSNGYRTKILVVHPPALERIWCKTVRDFEVPNMDFITNGSLHKIRHPEDYDLVIVDEAHKFRSDESAMFHQLQKLCKTPRRRPGIDGSKIKKVILVTATPLNNRPDDIRNQLYLFQDAKRSTLEVGNLQHFFRPLIDKYRKLKKEKDKAKIILEVKKIYDEIRNKILEPIIVRRTRTDIIQTPEYGEDIRSQNLTFPAIAPPRQVLYQLDENLNQLYDETVSTLKDTQNGLGYYRYQALKFLKADLKQHYKQADLISEQLAKIMKFLLVNRIGTQADTIYIYNFFPTVETDNEIELNKKAFMKLQSFHSALGEDSQIYSTDEEYGTFGLFEKIPEEEKDERLEYLMFLRHFRETEPEWFKNIRDHVPRRARSGRKDKTRKHHTIAYIKDNKRDCFYYLYDDLRFDELTFIEAVKIFKADVSERPAPLHKLHHDQINAAVNSFKTQTQLQALGLRAAIKLGPNDQRAIAFLNDMMKQEFPNGLEKETMASAKHAIKIGRFQKLPREINKLLKQAKEQRIERPILHQKLMRILKPYPLLEQQEWDASIEAARSFVDEKNLPQIIISESFIEGETVRTSP